MLFPITSLYMLVFAFLFTMLSYGVIKCRMLHSVGFGDGGHEDLNRAISAQSNFAQYVPMMLIILALCEMCNINQELGFMLGFLMLFGRVAHAYSVLVYETQAEEGADPLRFRKSGMVATFASLMLGSIFLFLLNYG